MVILEFQQPTDEFISQLTVLNEVFTSILSVL